MVLDRFTFYLIFLLIFFVYINITTSMLLYLFVVSQKTFLDHIGGVMVRVLA
jgi:hypothetical protein